MKGSLEFSKAILQISWANNARMKATRSKEGCPYCCAVLLSESCCNRLLWNVWNAFLSHDDNTFSSTAKNRRMIVAWFCEQNLKPVWNITVSKVINYCVQYARSCKNQKTRGSVKRPTSYSLYFCLYSSISFSLLDLLSACILSRAVREASTFWREQMDLHFCYYCFSILRTFHSIDWAQEELSYYMFQQSLINLFGLFDSVVL